MANAIEQPQSGSAGRVPDGMNAISHQECGRKIEVIVLLFEPRPDRVPAAPADKPPNFHPAGDLEPVRADAPQEKGVLPIAATFPALRHPHQYVMESDPGGGFILHCWPGNSILNPEQY